MVKGPSKIIDNVKYICNVYQDKKIDKVSIDPIGIDTEAYNTGICFMICTSLGDIFTPETFPRCLFSRKYRQQNFVVYNLKYDSGALLQVLPEIRLQQLREKDETTYNGYKYIMIGYKCLTIRRGKNAIHIYDIAGFYEGGLDYNAKKYLHRSKIAMETKTFTENYVRDNWDKIAKYCIRDCELTRLLAVHIIQKFEKFGVYTKKLYSTAFVSYQYFKSKCNYPVVRRLWKEDRKVLEYAMLSYNGGKFEITTKGTGYLYEYDIVSAYPYEIRNLIDISYARVVYSKQYRKYAVYGFLNCIIHIPVNIPSPVAIQINKVNTFPCGYINKVITKQEYEYFISLNVEIEIVSAVWLHVDNKTYPFRKEIDKLIEYKKVFKREGKELDYKTIKIFLNSLYGKFVQLIPKDNYWKASACWNPIYGSVITANTRINVSRMQHKYKSIIAVHTDSIISSNKLDIDTSDNLGDYDYVTEGKGIVLGCGIYQIGKITKIRGFNYKGNLLSMVKVKERSIEIDITKVVSWKEVIFHGWEKERINRFEQIKKKLRVDSDNKRIWLDDYKTFAEVLKRNVISLPYYRTESGI